MSDIFISYDSADRTTAQNFADALESLGLSVWWDREIPFGKPFDLVIEEELNAARCVIVLWSKEAVRSRWVKTEAAAAADRECLIPVLIEDIEIPFEFRRIQTAMLKNWHGDPADPEFSLVIQAVRQLLKQPQTAQPIAHSGTDKVSKLAQSWQTHRGWLVVFAAVLIIMVGAIALRTPGQKAVPLPGSNGPGGFPAGNPQSTGSSSTSAPPSGTTKSLPTQRAYSIKIGDKIDDGVPGPGAGSIETPYSQDVYVFSAAPKQRVYFRHLRHSSAMSYIKWRLTDADGVEVFNTCLGCTEPGVQTLRKGGSYTLTVGNDKDPGTGTYQLQLFDVPSPNQFSIKIGDTIKESVPGSGAGVIESPGVEDVYTFNATPRQRVYFRVWEYSTGLSYIKWKLTDDNGMELFDTCLGCSEPGVQPLVRGGSYTLTVGNQNDPSTGTYRLQLSNVPPADRFSIKIGAKIGPGIPGPGAGTIEVPGAEDVYAFSAAPGQKVYFRLLEHSKGTESIQWRLVDDNGTDLFNTCFGCTEPGALKLTKGGNYTLTVGNTRNPATGTYAFELGAQ